MSTDTSSIFLIDKNGDRVPFQYERLSELAQWACNGIPMASSFVLINSTIRELFDGMTTNQLLRIMSKVAGDRVIQFSGYEYVAGRLLMKAVRREVFGSDDMPHLLDLVNSNIEISAYSPEVLEFFNKEDFDFFNSKINHDLDFELSHAGAIQLTTKYLVKNRITNKTYETPQYAYMLQGMYIFGSDTTLTIEEKRAKVVDYYNMTSGKKLSMPTPIMAGVRTNVKQYSSCVVIEIGDNLKSVIAGTGAAIEYTASRAGLGIGLGVRGLGAPIRKGDAYSTGFIPYAKLIESAVASCSQGGVRKGSATIYTTIWHIEIERILVLKNNRGTEDSRVRHVDYGIMFNDYMLKRLIENKDISCFSYESVPGLYDAYFSDADEFIRLYEMYEADKSIKRETIPSASLFNLFANEKIGTARYYPMNVDRVNINGPFIQSLAPIRLSNLCAEIALPTKTFEYYDHGDDGLIALCTLAAVNLGLIPENFRQLPTQDRKRVLTEIYEPIMTSAVEYLDQLLSYQSYLSIHAERHTKLYRPLGIGVVNTAYLLAKTGVGYTTAALPLIHEVFEALIYFGLKASCNIAKHKGACEGFAHTKYSQGILPTDRYYKGVDSIYCPEDGYMFADEWETLRADILQYGLRNSTIMAIMPSETSSQVLNATNGIEKPRNHISLKSSPDGNAYQIVPEYHKYKDVYDSNMTWASDNRGYLNIAAVIQKWICQSISANVNYDINNYPSGKVPTHEIIDDVLYSFLVAGLKTHYYTNSRDHSEDTGLLDAAESACAGGGCTI
jgi:ribonucleoside-diphosphate reductase alpha chain